MDKNVVHTCSGILVSHREDGVMALAVIWMDLATLTLREARQAEKDECRGISLRCGVLKDDAMILFTKQKLTHRHRKQTWLPKEKGSGEG